MNMFATDYGSRNNIWVQEARRKADSANIQLQRAQRRIAELEEALKAEKMNNNAVVAVARTVSAELTRVAPNNPLANKDNRNKIYDANFKL